MADFIRYSNSIKYLKTAYRVDKVKALTTIIVSVIIDLLPSLKAIVMAKFLDNIIFYLRNQSEIYPLILSVVIFLSIYFIEYILGVCLDVLNLKFQIAISNTMEDEFLQKMSILNFEVFEDSANNDLFECIRDGVNLRFFSGFSTVLKFVGVFVRLFGIIFIIILKNTYVGIITLFMLCMIIPIAKKAGEEDYLAYENSRKEFRRAKAIREPLTERKYVEERTLFSFTGLLNPIWRDHYSNGIDIENKALKKNYFKTAISSISTAIVSSIIALVMVFAVKSGSISTGVYISLVTAVFSLVYMMSWNFSDLLEDIISNEKYISDYETFMNIKEIENIGKNSLLKREINSIKFENVSFTYPNAKTKALSGFSYEFKKGVSYALVGANGAGKSSIVKLMTGLYRDYTGEIYLNDFNIRCLSRDEIYKTFSIVYQDYIKYQLSIRDNIKIGNKNLDLSERFELSNVEDKEIFDILEKLNLEEKVKSTEYGLNTNLGKIRENGVDFSGGESQKLAIARSLMHDADIYILDEPTAALDPISEKKLYELYNDVFIDKTTIVITHRLGNTENQDVILVLDEGNLKEVGSHKELMNLRGLYYKMYEKQRSWYDEEKEIQSI